MNQMVKNIFSLQDNTTSDRDCLIDFLRGGGMILVLLHHSGGPLAPFILAFHMPLFFVLSGYLEFIVGGTKKPFKQYCKRKFDRLIVPYFSFELLNLFIWCALCVIEHRPLPQIESAISIIACINNDYLGMYGRLWFLPCMFMAEIYTWIVLHFFRDNKLAQSVCVIVLFAMSFVTDKMIPFRLPFTIDTAFFATAFIMLGYLFGGWIRILIDKGNGHCKVILMLCMILYLVYAVRFSNAEVYMFINSYGEYTVSVCASIAGSIAFLIIFSIIFHSLECFNEKYRLISNLVLWYGKNSLVSFPVHLTIKFFIMLLVPNFTGWYFLFLIMIVMNIPVVNVITYHFPFMLGKKRSKNIPDHCSGMFTV